MSRFRPVVSRRIPSGSSFAELFLAPGPEMIGQTGDNSYNALFGRDWLLVWDRDDQLLHLYQEQQGVWVPVVTNLPSILEAPAPAGSRRWSFAFDQAARIILSYEDDTGLVRVTRWDTSANQYVQNVTFAGVDAVVWMDATVSDPVQILSGGEREAVENGLGVTFEWLPTGQWVSNAIGDSDIILFYLSPDRSSVVARVQRELFATEHLIWSGDGVFILDRVITAAGRYQLLVSDANGDALDSVLASDPYIGDALLTALPRDSLTASVTPENLAAVSDMYATARTDSLSASVAPENLAAVGSLLIVPDENALDAGVEPEDIAVVGSLYPTAGSDALDAGVEPEDIEARVMDIPASDEDGLNGGITVEYIRVQTI